MGCRRWSVFFFRVALAGACCALAACAGDDQRAQDRIGDSAEVIGVGRDRLYVVQDGRWPSPEIPVCWETPGYATEKGWVKDEINKTWEAESTLYFTGWGQCSTGAPGIRIQVTAGVTESGIGYYSVNGVLNGMKLNLVDPESEYCGNTVSRETCVRTLARHEFGHALAFAHEQDRPDWVPPPFCNPARTDYTGLVMKEFG